VNAVASLPFCHAHHRRSPRFQKWQFDQTDESSPPSVLSLLPLALQCNNGYITAVVTKRSSPQPQKWVLLVHLLPAKPTNLRVRIWRQLLKVGAVAIKNSVYVLPASDKTYEAFQWLRQEIESAGGEATVFRATSVEGQTDQEIKEAFRKARNQEFAALTKNLDRLTKSIRRHSRGKHVSETRLATFAAELGKLRTEIDRVAANDFFNAKGQRPARTAYKRTEKTLQSTQAVTRKTATSKTKQGTLDLDKYQGRRWVTRRNLHIDRLATVWLIKQFIDKRPRFYFVEDGETVAGAIPFDTFGAEFTHQGEDCTFETMLKRFGLDTNGGLRQLAEIVHDIDLRDDKFHRPEAAGLNVVITGLNETLRDDRELLQKATDIFDGLFALLSRQPGKKQVRKRAPRPTRAGRRKSSRKKGAPRHDYQSNKS